MGIRTLAIDKAVSVGEVGATKTRRARSVPLAAPLAADLTELRKSRNDPPEDHLVIPNRSGGYWSRSEYNNWRNRVWTPVMDRLASGKAHPVPRLSSAIPVIAEAPSCRCTCARVPAPRGRAVVRSFAQSHVRPLRQRHR